MFNKLKSQNSFKTKPNLVSGFTLVELMVSVSIFALITFVSLGSVVAVLDANRKAQTLRSVMDNLNSSMESMSRSIRFGTNYHCTTVGTLSSPLDCSTSSSSFTVLDSSGTQVTYGISSNRLTKTVGGVLYYLTSSDVVIQSLSFRVIGSYPNSGGSTNDSLQPRVLIVVRGYVGVKANSRSTFSIGTMVSQRKFDYQ